MNELQTRRTLPLCLLGLLIAMCAVVGWLAFSGDTPPRQATLHTEFPKTMLQGVPGTERQSGLGWFGLAFGVLEISFFTGCLLLGLRPSKSRVAVFLLLGTLHVSAFVLMFIADYYYSLGELRGIFLGFPVPTALMIYGVGGVPLVFIILYVLCFDTLILTPSDLSKLTQIVQQRHSQPEKHP